MKRQTKITTGAVAILLLAIIAILYKMPSTPEQLQAQIDALKGQVSDLQKKQADVFNYAEQDYRFRQAAERVSDDFLPAKVLDLIWDNYFIYSTLFESLDGWEKTDVGAGTATINGGGIDITTGATSGDNSRIEKFHTDQDNFTFDNNQRFRTGFELSSVASMEVLIVVGDIIGGGGIFPAYYGFQVVNGALRGISTADNGFSYTAASEALSVNTIYEVQAKLKSKDKIVFYVKKENVDKVFRELGTINDNLPYSEKSINDVPVFTYKITTNSNAAKGIRFSVFEFAQEKKDKK